MAHQKHAKNKGAQKKSGKVPPASASKPPLTPAPTEQADGSPKPTNTVVVRKAVPAKPAEKTGKRPPPPRRPYNIPASRLNRPDFPIFMSGEGGSLEYQIEGDLSAPP